MSGQPLHGWKSAWRLFWSFLWRQALSLFALALAVGVLLSAMRSVGMITPRTLISLLSPLTTASLVLSCVASFRFLLTRYEIRDPRRNPVEQDRHQRR